MPFQFIVAIHTYCRSTSSTSHLCFKYVCKVYLQHIYQDFNMAVWLLSVVWKCLNSVSVSTLGV